MRRLPGILDALFQQLRDSNQNIPQPDFDRLVGQVTDRVRNEPPPQVALIGESGVGKSSTINALFNAGLDVGHTEATTQVEAGIEIISETVHGQKGVLVVYDMPGLGESMAKRSQHLATHERVLKNVDVALWILDAQYRALESVQKYLTDEVALINPSLVNRMVFALNKVDLVHPGDWVSFANLPSDEQELNIKNRILNVRKLVREALPNWDGTIIGYSATKRYNLPQLFAAMLDAVSKKRQWVLAEQMALADFLELVDPRLLPSESRDKQRNTKAQHQLEKKFAEQQSIEAAIEHMTDEEFDRFVAHQRQKRGRK